MLPSNERWIDADADYTLSTTSLHAVWPTLRNERYEWAVIIDTSSYDSRLIEAPKEPCQHPSVMKCGHTGKTIGQTQHSTALRHKRTCYIHFCFCFCFVLFCFLQKVAIVLMKVCVFLSDLNFVNVHDLILQHGTRYKVCIHANVTNSTYEKWTQIISEVSACSDGIVVDITPPSPGRVWIGWHDHIHYQVSIVDKK